MYSFILRRLLQCTAMALFNWCLIRDVFSGRKGITKCNILVSIIKNKFRHAIHLIIILVN